MSKLTQKTQMFLNAEQQKEVRHGAVYTSLAYMLMDCADSCMMFALDKLNKYDLVLPMEKRCQLEMTKMAVKQARDVITTTTSELYECSESDKLIEDADWLLQCIIEIMSRTNNNDYAKDAMLEYIKKYNCKIKTTGKKK
jgi:hypothetical protein